MIRFSLPPSKKKTTLESDQNRERTPDAKPHAEGVPSQLHAIASHDGVSKKHHQGPADITLGAPRLYSQQPAPGSLQLPWHLVNEVFAIYIARRLTCLVSG
ncbi:hypothetical protein GQ53DRAFT_755637 [Thozetella sp. PMI_491]|nr:hypothetical protein GQ53DRAFT_755637 [Thozetella sp. PMI_491]